MTSCTKRRSAVRSILREAQGRWSRHQQAAIYVKAPHPTAGKLFAEWLVSPEGQAAINAVGRPSARKGFKSKTSIENGWGPNVKPIVVSNKAYIEDARKWLDTAVKPVWEN